MLTRSALLFENGLPDLPALLVEPHRNPGGIWRIKFSYEASEPLSMSAVQASAMASALHAIGEAELADEIDGALRLLMAAIRERTTHVVGLPEALGQCHTQRKMDENGCRRIGAMRLRTGRARRRPGVPFGRKH